PQLQLQDDALAAIARYHWPGNVRELRNLVERAAILSDDEDLTAASLPAEVRGASAPLGALVVAAGDDGEILPLGEMEHRYVVAVLERLQGNISETARVLGVSRNTVKARLQPPL
ncbi:MAG: helix-turn-helix domain-containing protein, partial [Planctomycetota bacterium]